MLVYDESLTLEGKLAADFMHAIICRDGECGSKWHDVQAKEACNMAETMAKELQRRGWIKPID